MVTTAHDLSLDLKRRRIVLWTSCLAMGIGLSLLVTWRPAWNPFVKANSAAAFFLAGLAIQCLSEEKAKKWMTWIGVLCGCSIFLIGAATVYQFLFNVDLGIDRLFFREMLIGASPSPDRMAFNAAANFSLLGLAILMFSGKSSKWIAVSQVMIATIGLVAFLAFLSYPYGVSGVRFPYYQMTFLTAVVFLVLCFGMMWLRPKDGFMAIITSDTVGGIMARRLLPAALLFPFGLGLLKFSGQAANLFASEVAVEFLAVTSTVLFVSLVMWNAHVMYMTDAKRHRTEIALQNSEQQVRSIIETSGDAFISIDEQGIIQNWNRQAELTFGWLKTEAVGKSLTDTIIPPMFHQAHDRGLKRFLDSGVGPVLNKRIEIMAVNRAGNPFPVELMIWPIRNEDRYTFNAFIHDITDRKLAEERQIHLLKELEAANKELRDFAYVVSHDLKAPLRGITSLANWISSDYSGKLDQGGQEQLALLIQRVKRMHNLIDGILQYSRVGRMQEEKIAVDLNELISGIVNDIDVPKAIEIQVQPDLPKLHFGKVTLQQLFQNLLSNAVRFMDKPHGIIRVGCEDERSHWKFSVSDNGPGIEEKYFEKIFQIFQTLDNREVSDSTGIGLAIVKKIVETSGGKVWVESKVGQGSTFYFTLPKL